MAREDHATMKTWRALALAIVAAPAAVQPPAAQYDEAKAPAYTLPDPLRFEDGRPVTSPEAWRARRSWEQYLDRSATRGCCSRAWHWS
jgi:hypothetical protein